MKRMTEYDRVTEYIDRLFGKLNTKYYGGKLQKPIITIQERKGTYGHFTCGKVWKCESGDRHEINIECTNINRPIEEVIATLNHEMVHLYCMENNIQDTSRNGAYHNKRFKAEAEKRGLIIEHDEKIGWSITKPSENMIEWILEEEFPEIEISRIPNIELPKSKKKTNSHSIKYVCPGCGMTVRATKNLDGKLKCIDCNEIMER